MEPDKPVVLVVPVLPLFPVSPVVPVTPASPVTSVLPAGADPNSAGPFRSLTNLESTRDPKVASAEWKECSDGDPGKMEIERRKTTGIKTK